MLFTVHMLSFSDRKGIVREVNIPHNEYVMTNGDIHAVLELIFKYGQNDFQPQPCYSVSVGDVAEVAGEYWMVMGAGWKKLTKEEFDSVPVPSSTYACQLGLKNPA